MFLPSSLVAFFKGGLVWSPTAHVERPLFHRGGSVSTGDQPGYPFSIRHLAFLEKLIQYHVSLFWIFVVLQRLGEIVQRALALSLLGIVLGNSVVGPRVLIVGLEGSIEGFVGGLHVLSAQR